MLSKVVTLATMLVVIETRSQGFSHGHGHLYGHGHAYSSQSIMMHPQKEEPIYHHHSKLYPNKDRDHYQLHHLPVKTQVRYQPNQFREESLRPSRLFDRPGIPFDLNDARPHGIPFGINETKPHGTSFGINDAKPHGIPFGINGAKPNGISFGINDAKPLDIPFGINDARSEHGKLFGINETGTKNKPHHGVSFEVNDARPNHETLFSHHRMPSLNEDQNKNLNHHHVSNFVPKLQPHREYEFNYNIADIDTGDHKTHHESRNDGVVKGVYSFQEADGSIRIVEYTADEHNGFHANVRYEGLKHKVPKHRLHNHHHPKHQHLHQNNHQNFHPLLFNDS